MSTFGEAMRDADRWRFEAIEQANALARAAGLAGARLEDLVQIELRAAQIRAQAIAQLRTEVDALAQELGYTEVPDTLDYLNNQIRQLETSAGSAASGIGSAVQSIRGQLDLLLGDLSPFNDRDKLEIARGGLQSGSVSQEQFLTIARRLFGSSNRYLQEFQFAQGFPGQSGGGSSPGDGQTGGATSDSRSLSELIAARDALLEQQRAQTADTLARRLAELNYATGEGFAELAASRGFSLDQLAADLSLTNEQLTDYLESLSDQFGAQQFEQSAQNIVDAIEASAVAIIDAWRGFSVIPIAGAVRPGGNSQPVPEDIFAYATATPAPLIVADPAPDAPSAELAAVRAELAAVRELLERIAPASERSANAGEVVAVATEGTRDALERIRSDRPTPPRSTRLAPTL